MEWEPKGLVAQEKACTLVDPTSTCVYISRRKVPPRLLDILDKGKKYIYIYIINLFIAKLSVFSRVTILVSVYFSQIIERSIIR